MSQSDVSSILSPYLWELRADVQAQLRSLRSIQRRLDELARLTNTTDGDRLQAEVLANLGTMQDIAQTVVGVIREANEAAHQEFRR